MSKVSILTDVETDMLRIEVDGVCVFEDNDWGFTSHSDLPRLLRRAGVEVEIGEYTYED